MTLENNTIPDCACLDIMPKKPRMMPGKNKLKLIKRNVKLRTIRGLKNLLKRKLRSVGVLNKFQADSERNIQMIKVSMLVKIRFTNIYMPTEKIW